MPANEHVFFWATVESSGPLTVRRDGETEPLGVAPSVLVDPSMLRVGDRVWCQLQHRRALVLGVAGGVPQPEIAGSWQNLGVFGGWSESRALWRYRTGGIDVVFRGSHDADRGNRHRPFNIPGVTLSTTCAGLPFRTTNAEVTGRASFTINTDGYGVFYGFEQSGGWLDVNVFVPDYFLN